MILPAGRVVCPKDADRMTNSVDPDQTADESQHWGQQQTLNTENLRLNVITGTCITL